MRWETTTRVRQCARASDLPRSACRSTGITARFHVIANHNRNGVALAGNKALSCFACSDHWRAGLRAYGLVQDQRIHFKHVLIVEG